MALMGNLRNRAGLVIFVIGLAIVAFLLGDVVNSGMPFWAKKQNEVGSVNGESIDYKDFNLQVENTVNMYKQQMGGSETPQIRSFAVQQVWNQFISNELINAEIEKIGLTIGTKELNDLITGPNPSPQILQYFSNPQTGQLDRTQLSQIITEAKSNAELSAQWESLLESIRTQKLNEKYANLLKNSVYVTALEAQDEYKAKNQLANFKYLLLDYSSVKDAEIKLAESDYKEYYDKHKNLFKNTEESRAVEFISFDASPSANDTATVLANIQKLKTDLIASTNDSTFAAINSDTKYPVTFISKGKVSPALDSVIFNVAPGTTVGPYLSNGTYEIAKVIATKFSPDSVKASHILLNVTAEGGQDKALAKADSIKKLIQGGANFAALAVEFSQDPGSKTNGGDLGTFTRGQMVGPFEEAAFSGKAGDITVVNSQFGVHILKIEKQVGNSKIVKAAIVDKAILAGKETTDAAYSKANKFISEVSSATFEELAGKNGYDVQKVSRLNAMESNLNAIDAPRDLIRWIFEAKAGDVSTDKVFETDNNFLVVKVTGVNEKGIQPLETIKGDIEIAVRNAVKARMLKEKMSNALNGSSSIDQAAQKLGKSATAVENIVLANPVIPGVAQENRVIGTVFGLQPNKPSKAIEGSQGVYAVQVLSFINPKELVESERKEQQKQSLLSKEQRSWGSIFKALEGNASIDDNRIRFY